MQVRDGLASICTVIDDDAKALGEFEFFGDLRRGQKEVPEGGLIAVFGFCNARDRFFWNNEAMHRRLRVDVVNDNAVRVLVFNFCGDFAGDDLLKKGGVTHGLIGNLNDDDLQV